VHWREPDDPVVEAVPQAHDAEFFVAERCGQRRAEVRPEVPSPGIRCVGERRAEAHVTDRGGVQFGPRRPRGRRKRRVDGRGGRIHRAGDGVDRRRDAACVETNQ